MVLVEVADAGEKAAGAHLAALDRPRALEPRFLDAQAVVGGE
jgi:hypothetical protein